MLHALLLLSKCNVLPLRALLTMSVTRNVSVRNCEATKIGRTNARCDTAGWDQHTYTHIHTHLLDTKTCTRTPHAHKHVHIPHARAHAHSSTHTNTCVSSLVCGRPPGVGADIAYIRATSQLAALPSVISSIQCPSAQLQSHLPSRRHRHG